MRLPANKVNLILSYLNSRPATLQQFGLIYAKSYAIYIHITKNVSIIPSMIKALSEESKRLLGAKFHSKANTPSASSS